MREFNYSQIREQKWDSDILGYRAAIYKMCIRDRLLSAQVVKGNTGLMYSFAGCLADLHNFRICASPDLSLIHI